MNDTPYMLLAHYILPKEIDDNFDLIDVAEEQRGQELLLHLYLDEKAIMPEGYVNLTPNGFYSESCINDFPIRDHRTVLHVRRRRWKDNEGKSVSRDWQLVAKGTRHSKEFAVFLKEFLGYIPDYSQIAPETVSHQG